MVCFPYPFLIREVWKVPKKQGNSLPVLYFHTVCLPFSLILPLAWDAAGPPCSELPWSRVYGEAPAPRVCARPTSGPPPRHHAATAAPCQILALRCCQCREGTAARTCDRALHIKSSLNFRPLLPCSLKDGPLTSDSEASALTFWKLRSGEGWAVRQYTGLDFLEAFTKWSSTMFCWSPTGVFFFDSGRKCD